MSLAHLICGLSVCPQAWLGADRHTTPTVSSAPSPTDRRMLPTCKVLVIHLVGLCVAVLSRSQEHIYLYMSLQITMLNF